MKSYKNYFLVYILVSCLAFGTLADYNDCNRLTLDSKKLPTNKSHFELHAVCLCELRKQMNLEKHASLVYKQMASYFAKVDVAKRGFSKMFDGQAKEEHEHFDKFANYINLRGESVGTFDIMMPRKSNWVSTLEAMADSIELEHNVTNEIMRIHQVAEKTCNDIHLMNFLENEFIEEQISSINKLMKLNTILKNSGAQGYGEYLVDRDLQDGKLSLEQL